MAYPEQYDTRTACENGLHYFDGDCSCVHCGQAKPEPIELLLSESDFPQTDGLGV